MNLSAWSIKNPIPAAMLFVLLTLAGLLSFSAMKVQNFPDMDLPVVMVTAALPGAAPGQLESDVARKIENAIATTQRLKHITTTLVDGTATIAAEYQLEKPVQEAVDDVRSAVSRVRADLPADLRDPIVTKLELSSQPILAFAIASNKLDDQELSWFVDDQLTRRLLAVPGVGAVSRVGGVTREVRVALDPLKLQALGVTAAEVSHQLRQVQLESAGGRADLGGAEQPLRTLATLQTAEQIAALQIPLSGGRHARLDQLAEVSDTWAEPRTAALLGERPVIGFEVSRSRGASEIEVGAGVQIGPLGQEALGLLQVPVGDGVTRLALVLPLTGRFAATGQKVLRGAGAMVPFMITTFTDLVLRVVLGVQVVVGLGVLRVMSQPTLWPVRVSNQSW